MSDTDNGLVIGVSILDEEHAYLESLVEKMLVMLDNNDTSKLTCTGLIAEIYFYAYKHIKIEEDLMQQSSWEGLEHHQSLHREMMTHLNMLYGAVLMSETIDEAKAASKEIHAFLVWWWVRHIQNEDRQFATFLGK